MLDLPALNLCTDAFHMAGNAGHKAVTLLLAQPSVKQACLFEIVRPICFWILTPSRIALDGNRRLSETVIRCRTALAVRGIIRTTVCVSIHTHRTVSLVIRDLAGVGAID